MVHSWYFNLRPLIKHQASYRLDATFKRCFMKSFLSSEKYSFLIRNVCVLKYIHVMFVWGKLFVLSKFFEVKIHSKRVKILPRKFRSGSIFFGVRFHSKFREYCNVKLK